MLPRTTVQLDEVTYSTLPVVGYEVTEFNHCIITLEATATHQLFVTIPSPAPQLGCIGPLTSRPNLSLTLRLLLASDIWLLKIQGDA